jgi:hypothetical protein
MCANGDKSEFDRLNPPRSKKIMALISINKSSSASVRPTAAKRGRFGRAAAWVRGPTFARDITVVLIVKLALLTALKFAFFNHPQAEHMSLPPAAVAEKLLSVPTPAPTQGDHRQLPRPEGRSLRR